VETPYAALERSPSEQQGLCTADDILKGKWAWVIAAGVLVGALGTAARIALSSVRYVRSTLHPPRIPVSDADAPVGAVNVEVHDGTHTLRGWYVPTRNGAMILFAHGHGGNRSQFREEARAFTKEGYGVLMFDWPAHGESSGDRVTWGDRERTSFRAALSWAIRQPGVDSTRVGAVGFSMGGTIVLSEAVRDHRIQAVVAEAGYPSVEAMIRHDMRKYGWLSELPAVWTLRHEGIAVDELRPVESLCGISPRPILLIAGTDDPEISRELEQALLDAACAPKELWWVPGAHHGDFARTHGEAYLKKLVTFFNEEFRIPHPG
jgi:dienelactone hydrolase